MIHICVHWFSLTSRQYNELLLNTLWLIMKLITLKSFLIILGALTSLLGCAQLANNFNQITSSAVETKSFSEDSLFNRMGGLPVIKIVVSETVDEVSTNPKTSRSFKDIKLTKLKESITNHIC